LNNDPLTQFHRRQSPARATHQNNKADKKRPYEAFDRRDKPCSFTEILCIAHPSQSPQLRFFLAAIFNADDDDAFTLLYSYMAVEVKGRNLKEVRRAIQLGRCEFIQEYHENEFTKPGKSDPVIESIHFITGEKLDDILTTYREGR
jgi:hypothetical protein